MQTDDTFPAHEMSSDARRLGELDASSLVGVSEAAAFSTDPDGTICDWNEAAADLFGYAAEGARGCRLDTLLRPRDVHGNLVRRSPLPALDLVLHGEPVRPFELSLCTADGCRVQVLVGVVVFVAVRADEHRVVYLLEHSFRRRRSDEVIERMLAERDRLPTGRSADANGDQLTRRQYEVLRLLAGGEGPQEIADRLSLSVYTVRSHLRAIYERLGAHSQSEAVAKAYKLRLI